MPHMDAARPAPFGLGSGTLILLSLLVLILASGKAFPLGAQASDTATGSLEGQVLAVDSEAPIPGARVSLEGTDRAATTDSRGHFSLRGLPAGSVTLAVSRLGFSPRTVDAEVRPGERTRIEVVMSTSPVGLDPVLVRSRRTHMVGDPLNLGVIPGSAHFLSHQDLEERKLAFDNVHDMLRRIPGVNVHDEEGYGLRPHIGMRGTGVERASKVTLMEDGVLIAPAPYAAPAAYYFPVAGRMEAIEVRKGSSQVRYGPRTVGGAVNLVSASVPDRRSWNLDARGGEDRSLKMHFRGGDAGDRFGWMVETYQVRTDGFKQLEGGGDTGFRVGDYLAKFRLNTHREASTYQELELTLGYHDELSNETYLGLTHEDFRTNALLRYPASQPDEMDTEHDKIQLRHFIQPSRNLDVSTTLYRHSFARNWYKLHSVRGTGIGSVFDDPESHAEEMAILRGADSEADAFMARANNREYLSRGVQTIVGLRLPGDRMSHELEFGLRLHEDEEDRFQWEDGYRMTQGTAVRTSQGTPGSQANRVAGARALALHLQDEIQVGRLTLVPGVRYENIRLTRTDYPTTPPDRDEPTRVRELDVSALIPGVGVAFELSPSFHLFGGVHRGFGPPGPGAAQETRPEESVNYEVGTRLRSRGLALQVAGFFSDYRNILGEATLASGDTGVGRLFNGGAVHTFGLETSVDYDLAPSLHLPVRLPASLSYTYTRATFQTAFESDFGAWGTVEEGDHLPYLPTHQFSGSLGIEDGAWRMSMVGTAASSMRTRAGQGPTSQREVTDAYLVLTLQGEYELSATGGAALYGGVQNLTDRHYIAARRPAGARPGLPRTLFLGLRVSR